MSPPARVALYFAPATDSPWWRFGSAWVGRDAATDIALAQPAVPGIAADELATITAAARRYGFHATLKAPFALAPGVALDALTHQLDCLARRLPALPLGALQPTRLAGFVALRPAGADHARLEHLAHECITSLDHLRAPWDPADFERRAAGLDARGRELLQRWGYAHVFERFRFHLTLSAPLDEARAQRLIDALQPTVADLNRTHPPQLDRLCLFVEPTPGALLRRVADYPLTGSADYLADTSGVLPDTSRSSGRQ
jgi:putative phosphonate metabolism protein